jgi:glucans biosynthesis protein
VDFEGGKLAQLGADTVLRAYVTVASGETTAEVVEQQAYKNTVTGGWRLAFQVRPLRNDPVELRAFLDLAGEALTETWTYTLVP